jgi:hypothetical protein
MKKEDAPSVHTGSHISGTGDDSSTVVKKKKKKKILKRLKSTYEVGKKPDKELKIEGKLLDRLAKLAKVDGAEAEDIILTLKLDKKLRTGKTGLAWHNLVDTVEKLMKEDRNYRDEYDNYHKKPEQRKRNAGRLRARRFMEKLKKVKKNDKMDVHHKDNDPTNNDPKNLSVTTQKYNRSEPRKREMKKEDTAVAVAPTPIIPDTTFAGMPVFKVADSDFQKCKFGKTKHSRWNKHIDIESKFGKRVYGYAKKHPKQSIIIQHERNGHMLYLRKYSRLDGGKSGIMVKKGIKK